MLEAVATLWFVRRSWRKISQKKSLQRPQRPAKVWLRPDLDLDPWQRVHLKTRADGLPVPARLKLPLQMLYILRSLHLSRPASSTFSKMSSYLFSRTGQIFRDCPWRCRCHGHAPVRRDPTAWNAKYLQEAVQEKAKQADPPGEISECLCCKISLHVRVLSFVWH